MSLFSQRIAEIIFSVEGTKAVRLLPLINWMPVVTACDEVVLQQWMTVHTDGFPETAVCKSQCTVQCHYHVCCVQMLISQQLWANASRANVQFINDIMSGLYTKEYMASHSLGGKSSKESTTDGLPKADIQAFCFTFRFHFSGAYVMSAWYRILSYCSCWLQVGSHASWLECNATLDTSTALVTTSSPTSSSLTVLLSANDVQNVGLRGYAATAVCTHDTGNAVEMRLISTHKDL